MKKRHLRYLSIIKRENLSMLLKTWNMKAVAFSLIITEL